MLRRNNSWYDPPCGVLFIVVVVVGWGGGYVMCFDQFRTLPFKISLKTSLVIVISLQHAQSLCSPFGFTGCYTAAKTRELGDRRNSSTDQSLLVQLLHSLATL